MDELAAAAAVTAVDMDVDIDEGTARSDDPGSETITMDMEPSDQAAPANMTDGASICDGNAMRGVNVHVHPRTTRPTIAQSCRSLTFPAHLLSQAVLSPNRYVRR